MYQVIKGRRRRAPVAAGEGAVAMSVSAGLGLTACAALFAVVVIGLVVLSPSAAQAAGAPAIAFSPSSYDYKTIDAGTTASQTFALTNSGGTATRALAVSLPDPSAFSKTVDTCTGTSLGPKKSCSVTVEYAPTSAGASDSAKLTASSKKPTVSATASLTGASTVPPKSQSQILCESFHAPWYGQRGFDGELWTCSQWLFTDDSDFNWRDTGLRNACLAEGGTRVSTVPYINAASTTCFAT